MIQINKIIEQNRKRERDKIKKGLTDKLNIARDILITEFNPARIILIGSMVNREKLHLHSDIDIVVEGLGDDYLKAGGRLLDIIGESIDLKPYEYMDNETKEMIEIEGVVIYEKSPPCHHNYSQLEWKR